MTTDHYTEAVAEMKSAGHNFDHGAIDAATYSLRAAQVHALLQQHVDHLGYMQFMRESTVVGELTVVESSNSAQLAGAVAYADRDEWERQASSWREWAKKAEARAEKAEHELEAARADRPAIPGDAADQLHRAYYGLNPTYHGGWASVLDVIRSWVRCPQQEGRQR